ILPYGSKAPSLPDGAQNVDDPARIILPNQNTLLVEDFRQFSRECALYSSNNGASLFNLPSSSVVVAIEEIAAVEVGSLTLGSTSSLNAAVGK
ncbi:hypothetical protein, partial [Klebsiella pneumoniae]|uniref:hypothetical protein n=1 Tax=Klebsiella pneumoniae TaxID=573 RepID=UPI003462988E